MFAICITRHGVIMHVDLPNVNKGVGRCGVNRRLCASVPSVSIRIFMKKYPPACGKSRQRAHAAAQQEVGSVACVTA